MFQLRLRDRGAANRGRTARRSTAAHSASVAPVVTMSSTSSTFFPATSLPAGHIDAPYICRHAPRGSENAVRGFAFAFRRHGAHGRLSAFRKRARNQFRLIVSPLLFPFIRKRYPCNKRQVPRPEMPVFTKAASFSA